jgi:hypothetical protein
VHSDGALNHLIGVFLGGLHLIKVNVELVETTLDASTT